jgi:hypothetical protein
VARRLNAKQLLFLRCMGAGHTPGDIDGGFLPRTPNRWRGPITRKLGLPRNTNWIKICYEKKVPLRAPAFATAGIVLPRRLVNALWVTYWFGDLTQAASWICLTRKELRGRLAECRVALNCDTNEQCILVAIDREWFMPSKRPTPVGYDTVYSTEDEIVRVVKVRSSS